MSRLLEAWEALQRQATSRDYDEQQYAAFQIGLVLERHNPDLDQSPDVYEENLSRELMRLRLDDDRQRAAIDFLVAMVRSNAQTADTFLYALSRVRADLLLDPLIALIDDRGKNWDDSAAYEAISALTRCLRTLNDVATARKINNGLRTYIDEQADSEDELLSERADNLLQRIDRLLETA